MKPMIKLAALAATTVLSPVAVQAQESDEQLTVGLAVANLQANFFNQIKQSVESYAQEQGVGVITVDAQGDGATQVSQVQDLLSQNIDALIYVPAGAAAATVPTRLARAADVPVINIDRNPEGEPGDTFIASDSVSSAEELCRYMFEQIGGEGQMAIIHGQRGTTPEVDRSQGCAQAREDYPDIEVVAEQYSQIWSQDEGFQMAQNMLQANPGIDLFWGQADALALGAAQAVKVANLDHEVLIGGFDGDTAALQALADGVFDVTATQQTQRMGRMAIDSAAALVSGEDVPEEQLLDATLTTQENVQQFIENHP